ncbi:KHG/KDPG aldolase/sugar kinase fusion protein [Treponema denticola]|jgi:2-dehydro-3-deoxyphosphogluconate aldolase/4-hydroxy-2-oxoglutarate aldolase|uniref:KHG/KDPG aldolase/sugar kinase fusion protein n=1 Tax=Treponema denticola TaxID=158 RepID=UPI0001FD35F8|nr:KHG/KDPG aldolase/sugar kinase fusion protein [Treponema denticola]EGC78400.1 PfkB family KHG/KDPG family aldolase/carbohydrate kinase [Treponema denticola F0402]EMB42631.1 2-dehydro-3-deoxyphosphogluconate aldolase/4-hydroxy-2-oxoglutarate aldolase [Treponema denticola ATCC 33520]UTC86380.1 bifunctional 4-hydroxy-2-oxoglutarate aldolase/2-dehydro-3-deoxy-phosphogluconate aldolase [Treponema denticola]
MNKIFKQIEKIGIVPVIVLDNEKDALPLGKALSASGLFCAEITFRTEAAEKAIKVFSKNFPDFLVGAGTVLSPEQADKAIAAGAKFIVSPGLNPKVVEHCVNLGYPIIPGVSTAGEIEQAMSFGLETVKFFPAEAAGGLKFIKAISAPYPNIKFMPTGGINAQNIAEYAAFSKVIACGGSWMVSKELISSKDFKKIEEESAIALQMVKEARNPKKSPGALTTFSYPKTSTEKKPSTSNESSLNVGIETNQAPKVITMGEIMLRLSPTGFNRFVQADALELVFGGAEANVAVSLANFGMQSSYITKLPAHEIGQAAVNSLRRYGVDVSGIIRGGKRIGIYFLEKGASQRASKVIYDRTNSAIAEASPSDFNWKEILKGASWFHFTGITPALSKNAAEICLEACKTARSMGITVSCDLNYRKKLWTPDEAKETMSSICEFVDICISNEEDADKVFGITSKNTDVSSGKLNEKGYKEVAEKLCKKFGFQKVGITLRESTSASENNWSAMLYTKGKAYFSKKYTMQVVDRLGGGDSFAAALICAELKGFKPQKQIDFASAASCLKHSINGDFNQVSFDEVLTLAQGDASGRVQR